MEWKRQCPGFKAYRWQDDGRVEVEGSGFEVYAQGTAQDKLAKKVFEKYAGRCVAWSETRGFPAAWICAIICIESAGNPYACSPCTTDLCSYAKAGKCGGGIGKDGKNYVCCGYGLMQIVDANAKAYGLKHGGELMGDVETSLKIGTEMLRKLLVRSGGDPLMAAKYYNGCSPKRCQGGQMISCTSGCKFGIGGQNSYAEKFVKYANMFVSMLEQSPPPKSEPDPDKPTPQKVVPGGMMFSSDDLSKSGVSLAAMIVFAGLTYYAFRVAQSVS